ncbi:MAG: ATP-binding protein [Firmicutes bacterium]|nr:ATP-binding protein [Bacillota bacterium]
MDRKIEFNIQPEAGIMNVFSRLNYEAQYALAEFVDNSTQSYFNNEKKIKDSNKNFERLEIDIVYDEEKDKLSITDNAYGMNLEEFKYAILLDSKHPNQQGRNEFGMGLKTAASWFGNNWSVFSTQLGRDKIYSANVDINHLKNNRVNTIDIIESKTTINSHSTIIVIRELTKKLTRKTLNRVRDLLGSMYRRDIESGKVQITLNGEIITYQPNAVLQYKDRTWKKELNFNVEFRDKIYHVDGFVAIMNPGSFRKAGFALFRNNRVVIGGDDCNYKPLEIFGQLQSQIALKLFGELNMNSFPVNQAKAGFIWNDGLEEEFIRVLKENIEEYRKIADMSKQSREEVEQFSPQKSESVEQDTKLALEKLQREPDTEIVLEEDSDLEETDLEAFQKNFVDSPSEIESVGTLRKYEVPLNNFEKIKLCVTWTIGKSDYWIDLNEEKEEIQVIINIDHPFFKPHSNEEHFKKVLEKFVIAFVVAEKQALSTSGKDGYVSPSAIRNKINEILSKMSKE